MLTSKITEQLKEIEEKKKISEEKQRLLDEQKALVIKSGVEKVKALIPGLDDPKLKVEFLGLNSFFPNGSHFSFNISYLDCVHVRVNSPICIDFADDKWSLRNSGYWLVNGITVHSDAEVLDYIAINLASRYFKETDPS